MNTGKVSDRQELATQKGCRTALTEWFEMTNDTNISWEKVMADQDPVPLQEDGEDYCSEAFPSFYICDSSFICEKGL